MTSTGKGEVVAWALRLANRALDFDRCTFRPNVAELEIAKKLGQEYVPLVPESLLLDARAEVDRLSADNERLRGAFDDEDEKASVHWYAEWVEQKRAREQAEALAAELEKDARRYRIWRDHSNPLTDALRIEAADLYGKDLDIAIDARAAGSGEG